MPPSPSDPSNEFRDNSKKFIGGAEAARRKARRPKNAKTKKEKKKKNIVMKHAVEVFYTSLLKCNVGDLLNSNKGTDLQKQVLNDILDRAGMPTLTKLPSTYENYIEYYSLKASLVLEEARCQISQELSAIRQKRRRRNSHNNSDQLVMTLVKATQKKHTGNMVLLLEKTQHYKQQHSDHPNSVTYFTPKEQFHMKPGCLHEISFIPSKGFFDPENIPVAITYVQPIHNFGNQQTGNARAKLVMCNTSEISEALLHKGSRWRINPLTTLISCQRQFEGCTRFALVPFMSKLCAWKEPTHTRFDENGNEKKIMKINAHKTEDKKENEDVVNAIDRNLADLNDSQEEAASAFINSPPSSLTLVQGPPGTGKTTFLISVIYRDFLLQNDPSDNNFDLKKRVMVTAPTNRAVTVLANRFLNFIDSDCPLNLVLIGVEDKLMSESSETDNIHPNEDTFTVASLSPSLRSIYVYTWLENIMKLYHDLGNELFHGMILDDVISSVTKRTKLLNKKLSQGIPMLCKQSCAFVSCEELVAVLTQATSFSEQNTHENNGKWNITQLLAKAKQIINTIISCLRTIQPSEAIQELLSTANIVFCTLSTAGTSFVKSTKAIDDLFVDEAAAASEAELCIPYHLLPKRMLAVGDPKQLPVTVLSREASRNGLGKSLHERLMYDCGKEHMMLNVQYRMRPEISEFPSDQFYKGEISNGTNVTSENYKNSIHLMNGAPYSFYDVIGKEEKSFSGSYYNMQEAIAVTKIVQTLAEKATNVNWDSSEKVRIITFYQGQVSCIKRLLLNKGFGSVLVATVDSSQGSEAETIIISFVRSSDKVGSEKHTTAGFLADDRRLNVALTRAKYQLICVGNASSIAQSGVPSLKALVINAEERSCITKSQ